MPAQRTPVPACHASGQPSDAPALPTYTRLLSVASTPSGFPPPGHLTAVPADSGPAIRTAAPLDLTTFTTWQLRVVIYASGYQRRYDDIMSPTCGISRMVTTLTAAAVRLGMDTIRAVAEVLEYAEQHHDTELIARFCPDTNRWRNTASSANAYRHYITGRLFDPSTVDHLADQYTCTDMAAAA